MLESQINCIRLWKKLLSKYPNNFGESHLRSSMAYRRKCLFAYSLGSSD